MTLDFDLQAPPLAARDRHGSPPPWSAHRALSVSIALIALTAAGICAAAESASVSTARTRATLISDHDVVAAGQEVQIGLHHRLAPHWHTYWRNPGDAGSPPRIRLQLPDDAEAGEVRWPGPDRLPSGPLVSFGYEGEALLPIPVRVPARMAPGDTFSVLAEADWVVCKEECIPEEGRFRLELPIAQEGRLALGEAAAFAAAERRMPEPGPAGAQLVLAGTALVLELSVPDDGSERGYRDPFFFPHQWGVIEHAGTQAAEHTRQGLRLVMQKGPGAASDARVSGVLARTDAKGVRHWQGLSAPVRDASPVPPEPSTGSSLQLGQALLLAFLGGLILNLMPCVFPVLAIKAASLGGLSGRGLRGVRAAALLYTLGVVAAFSSIALLLLAVKAGGASVGWGFQFQSPVFVAAMSWLMLGVALNLLGVFEIGARLTGVGQGLADKPGWLGSFFTGVLAVVLATPCTAPFMGAAVGFALASPPATALVIFLALGLGLAAPYGLLAIHPGLAERLPRPGSWMVRLRELLAFPMLGASAWLLWVLARQGGDQGLALGLIGALLVAVVGWAIRTAQSGPDGRLPAQGLAAVSMLGLAALAWPIAQLPVGVAQGPAAAGGRVAEPIRFSRARLDELRAEGRPVLVNMTAAWCITCLVNERTTLGSDRVQMALAEHEVSYLKGDWTSRDAEISAYLAEHGREGVPFYAYYPPAAPAVLLPTILTPGLVVSEIERDRGERVQ